MPSNPIQRTELLSAPDSIEYAHYSKIVLVHPQYTTFVSVTLVHFHDVTPGAHLGFIPVVNMCFLPMGLWEVITINWHCPVASVVRVSAMVPVGVNIVNFTDAPATGVPVPGLLTEQSRVYVYEPCSRTTWAAVS